MANRVYEVAPWLVLSLMLPACATAPPAAEPATSVDGPASTAVASADQIARENVEVEAPDLTSEPAIFLGTDE